MWLVHTVEEQQGVVRSYGLSPQDAVVALGVDVIDEYRKLLAQRFPQVL